MDEKKAVRTVNGMNNLRFNEFYEAIRDKIKELNGLKKEKDIFNEKNLWWKTILEQKDVQDLIIERDNLQLESLSDEYIKNELLIKEPFNFPRHIKTKWEGLKIPKKNVGDIDSFTFQILKTFLRQEVNIYPEIEGDLSHDLKNLKVLKGYYFSYLKNKICTDSYLLKISKSDTNNKLRPFHDYFANLKGFHDEGDDIIDFIGSGYEQDNKLYLTLESTKIKDKRKPETILNLILSVAENWNNNSNLKGVLTGVSKASIKKPILSMETILVDYNESEENIENAKTYLALHKYSFRQRVNQKALNELGIHNDSYTIDEVNYFLGNYQGYRFDNDWKVVRSQLLVNNINDITCSRRDINGKTLYHECDLQVDRIDRRTFILSLKSYKDRKKRFLAATLRLNWKPDREIKKGFITGEILTFYENRKFHSPIIFYNKGKLKDSGKISYLHFAREIGLDEFIRLRKFIKKLYVNKN